MVTIGNTDQVMALVRSQLERMARNKRAGAPGKTASTAAAGVAARTRLQALAQLTDLPDEEFERVLVRALLTQEFGEEVAGDARFQAVVDRTARLLRDDPRLAEAVGRLRSGLGEGNRSP